MQHYNHVGNITAIAVFSSLGGIIAIVFFGLALRRRIVRRRKAEQKTLLAAGSSAYSMVPVPEDPSASASEVKLDRLSMMFSDEPARLSGPMPGQGGQGGPGGGQGGQGGGQGGGPGVTVHATPLLSPQQAMQPQYQHAYPAQI